MGAFLILPGLVGARVALVVAFCLKGAEPIGQALPVEGTTSAAVGRTRCVVGRDAPVRIVAVLGVAAQDEEEDGEGEGDCEGG